MLGAAVLWVLLGIPAAKAVTEFFVPGAAPYPHWKAGDVQRIRYRTTFTAYTIALWQQFDGAAKLGPIVYQTTNGPDSEFAWLVQSYNLDLNTSNYFFFWLFEGGPSAQASGSSQQSSGFFWINESTTTTTTTTSSSLPSSSSSATSFSLISVSTVHPTTGGDSKATGDAPQNNSTGELSTGAKAGVGVGAGAAGLGILATILLFAKHRSRKKRELEGLRSSDYDSASRNMSKTALPSSTVAQQPPPSELPGHYERATAELA